LGKLALGLYGCLPYGRYCRANHIRHHPHPTEDRAENDPDQPARIRVGWACAGTSTSLAVISPAPRCCCWLAGGRAVDRISQRAPFRAVSSLGLVLCVVVSATLPLLPQFAAKLFVFDPTCRNRDRHARWQSPPMPRPGLPEWLSFLLACYPRLTHWEHHEFPSMALVSCHASRAFALQRGNSSPLHSRPNSFPIQGHLSKEIFNGASVVIGWSGAEQAPSRAAAV